jgi:hypothetical protein
MKRILLTIVFLLLLAPLTYAQEPAANAKASDTARREQALELLKSLATQVGSLQSPENRARIGANIAESLWKHDENRARALFIGIEDDIKLGLQNREISEAGDRLTISVFIKLRADTVQRIAKYDPELALSFLNATEPERQVTDLARVATEAQRNVEVQLAKKIAGTNPDIALQLGRKALARGFSGDLLSLLQRLHRKHRDKGVTLYKETVQKLRDADLVNDDQALWFARQLVNSLTPPTADESSFRELIDLLLTKALANGCDKKPAEDQEYSSFCQQISALVATLDKVDPARGRKLKHFEQDYDDTADRAFSELYELTEDGTVEEILQLAEKYPRLDVTIYARAMAKAYESGDIERAKKIANSYPGDPSKREILLEQLKRDTTAFEMTEQQLAEAMSAAERIRVERNRIFLLIQLAGQIDPKNKKMVLKLLDQAAGLIENLKTPGDKMEALLRVAMSYCQAGNARGLDIVEAQIPKLNELIDASVRLDGFDTRYLRDGEWNMSANGRVGNLLTGLSENAGDFAWCDFDRAVSLAAQFERSEIRMMAQVKLAQSILAGPPRRGRYPYQRIY